MRSAVNPGSYRTEQRNDQQGVWAENPSLGVKIQVQHLHTKHYIKDQIGASSGRFAFTANDPGTYSICFSTNQTGWFSHELCVSLPFKLCANFYKRV
jgi:hypothetical protein